MTTTRYPLFFRIQAIISLLVSLSLFFCIILVASSGSQRHMLYLPAMLLVAVWLFASALFWFFASKNSLTFIYTASISLLLLTISFLQGIFLNDSPAAKQENIPLWLLIILCLLFTVFLLGGLFYPPLQAWQKEQKPIRSFKPSMVVFVLYLLTIFTSFYWYSHNYDTLRRTYFRAEANSNNEEEIYESESTEMIEEGCGEDIYEVTVSNEELQSLYGRWGQIGNNGLSYIHEGPNIEIAGQTFKEYVGSPHYLYEHFLFMLTRYKNSEDPDNYYDRYRGKILLAEFSGNIDVYSNSYALFSEGKMNYVAGVFQHINPEIVKWATANLIPNRSFKIGEHTTGEIYNVVYRRFFRLMLASHYYLKDSLNVDAELERYKKLYSEEGYHLPTIRSWYSNSLNEYACSTDIDCSFQPADAISFWMRRKIDGSELALIEALKRLLVEYDNDWLQQNLVRRNKS